MRPALAVGLLSMALMVPSIPAVSAEGFPIISGAEWTDMAREGLGRLPNLVPPATPGVITGDPVLDDRIWEIAFARGYEMRQTPAGALVVQDGHSMQAATADAWEALQAAASAAGHSIVIHSAYRSVATQKAIFNLELTGTSDAAINAVLDYHAPPGASRHHTGYALDIKLSGGTIGGFGSSAAFGWISANNYENAKKYGFIPSYPPDAPSQGPKPEPWEYLYVGPEVILDGDEMLFYRDDGLFKYYDVGAAGTLGAPIRSGTGYTAGWSSITAVDIDDVDNQDEVLFYREDGLFKFYDIDSSGALGAAILEGSGYTSGWSTITGVDLDGDGQDELFFYREDGLFKYYDVSPGGALGAPILSGTGYTSGWSTIAAVDLDGDGQDEMFFYRNDGLFKYYDINPGGSLGSPILSGTGYTSGWDSISALDLDGGGHDEMFFYREDGLFKYYDIGENASLGSPILEGTGYTVGWTVITGLDLD